MRGEAYSALNIGQKFENEKRSLYYDMATTTATATTATTATAKHGEEKTKNVTTQQVEVERRRGESGGGVFDELQGMSKAQKRNRWDQMAASDGTRLRGWNWVDIVSHLSKGPATAT
eukprot:GHVS01048821.1.p2 GENE.GHVS01048821.1~~GHVS01048821.1.p2  ORF type:complete len:117 (-),score=38.06 GHVS01048821.1:480-830(-)